MKLAEADNWWDFQKHWINWLSSESNNFYLILEVLLTDDERFVEYDTISQ